jgi:hypothetical protein
MGFMSDVVLASVDDVILIIFGRQRGKNGVENERERVMLKKFRESSNFSEISRGMWK